MCAIQVDNFRWKLNSNGGYNIIRWSISTESIDNICFACECISYKDYYNYENDTWVDIFYLFELWIHAIRWDKFKINNIEIGYLEYLFFYDGIYKFVRI